MNHKTTFTIASEHYPDVSLKIRRISFGRRLELARKIRALGQALEHHAAGTTVADRIESGLLNAELDRIYLEWGLAEINGLEVDGAPSTPARLFADGPEDLANEALMAIKRECCLSEVERKNFKSPSNSST